MRHCEADCEGFKLIGIDACMGCAGNSKQGGIAMSKLINMIKQSVVNVLDPMGECDHGMMRCTCGVCTKHPMAVSVKGGHVVGSSSGSPTNITAIGCCHNPRERNYHW